ncbi:MAG: hypothetical protein WDZ88_02415 [Candidatus Paceibacterota bacterium]
MQKGFIQIPILIMILIGTAVVGGGGYYAAKEISKTNTTETEQEQTENVATNESATSTTSASSTETGSVEVSEDENIEKIIETITQTSVEPQSTNSPVDDISVDTSPTVAVEPPQVNLPKQYPLDQSTENICDDAFEEDDSNSYIKNIVILCDEADKKKYENKADFDEVIEEIHDEWDDWENDKKMAELEAESKQAQEEQERNTNNNVTQSDESTSPTPKDLAEKYATVIKLSDSKGNVNFQSEHNEQEPTWLQPWPELEVGDTVTFSVDVANQISSPVSYQFVGTGFPNEWQNGNSVTVTIDEDVFNTETIHLRVFVKNSDSQYRAPNYDDMIQVFYTKE